MTRTLLARATVAAIFAATLLAPSALRADEANAAKARALVDAAINMTDSDQAVKLLWQATDIDPRLTDAYTYLGLYYNSRSQFDKVIEVYQKYLKYRPDDLMGDLNVGEAYMSYSPPKYDDALVYYKKAYQLDHTSVFAALRIGEILAHQGNHTEALTYLKQAAAATAKSPGAAAEAQRVLKQLGVM